jgi:WD40 repeat protein
LLQTCEGLIPSVSHAFCSGIRLLRISTWGDISDRFPGHPSSLDAIVKVDEDTLLTGSSDGLIRVVSIQPDKLLGVIGDHEGFPIEKLQFNADRNFVGSLTHDNVIRLWDARILQEDFEDERDGDVKIGVAASLAPSLQATTTQTRRESDDEWEEMDEDEEMEEEDDDNDSDSDDDDNSKSDGKNDRAGRFKFKSDNEKFFEDL